MTSFDLYFSISPLILADLAQRAAILSTGPYLLRIALQVYNKDAIVFRDVEIYRLNEGAEGFSIQMEERHVAGIHKRIE